MRLTDVVNFRKDLLFEGAVQLGWFENDRQLADKVAEHFVFHGPKYHGIASGDTRESYSLVDTATFALDVMKRVSGQNGDDPFTIAIAGYGTGKSHLALTLSCLLSDPKSRVAEKILANIRMADADIGAQARDLMNGSAQPFLVVTLNGAQDFDLSAEIIRQSPMPTLSAPRRMKMRSRGMLLYTPARRGRVTLVPKSPTGSLT